eukprot:5241956-Alexandrium_andersonii.AAC.1
MGAGEKAAENTGLPSPANVAGVGRAPSGLHIDGPPTDNKGNDGPDQPSRKATSNQHSTNPLGGKPLE